MSEYFEALGKYNVWNGEQLKTGYKREGYLTKIEKLIGTSLVKVLIGQRRTGKSYLLRQIMELLIERGVNPVNICYLNKEFFEFDSIDSDQKLFSLIFEYRNKLKPSGRVYLLFDEIQSVQGWEKVVNSLSQNTVDEVEVFITGSNSTMLSGELATLLSGRYVSFIVFPFSFNEFAQYYALVPSRESMVQYLKSGGLPELVHINDEEMRRHYIQSLRDTIILRDIVQRYHIKDAWLLENLFNFLVSQTGHLLSVNNIVNYFITQKIKTNHETITNYLNYLKQAFLIHEAPRYNIKAKELLSGVRKFYLNDLAFRNFAMLKMDTGLSQNIENMIFLNYLSAGYHVFVGTLHHKEIDFIVESGNERQYIQATYMLTDAKVIEREFGNLELIADHYPKKVISLDDVSIGNRNGIEHVCAWKL